MINIRKFEAIGNWLHINYGTEDAAKRTLLSLIDLSRLSNDELQNVVRPTRLFDAETLLDAYSLRLRDVNPEREELFCTTFSGLQITAANPENIFGYAAAITVNGQSEIGLKMDPVKLNYIEFNVDNSGLQEWKVQLVYMPDRKSIEFSRKSNGMQKFYFDEREICEIRLLGVDRCKNLKALTYAYSEKGHAGAKGLLVPKVDVITSDFAYILGRRGAQLLNETFEPKGVDTPFTEIPPEGVEIYFYEPYVLEYFLFRLWDFDGRKQSCQIYRIHFDDLPLALITSVDNTIGWHHSQRRYYCKGIKIVPGKNNPENILRLAYFAASGEQLSLPTSAV